MPEQYEVYPYDIEQLCRLLTEKAPALDHVIDAKRHRVYFSDYFDKLCAQTIVVENQYVDRDYLEDYAGYYVRCFHFYDRFCVRLHFFSHAFQPENFDALLSGDPTDLTPELLQEHYLGFVVVKPLPQTVIGRTCLKTYPHEGRRYFPVLQSCKANLFGVPLTVESLPFQEQDHVAAACATSALWSVFYGSGHLFQHPIPSPVEITKSATAHSSLTIRTFPNSSGLNMLQMADAIRSVGLEPCAVKAGDQDILKCTLYAYLRGHIPVQMVINLFDYEQNSKDALPDSHAIAVAGYSLGEAGQHALLEPEGKPLFHLRALRMDKLFAHDDQVGPFARFGFQQDQQHLTTSWLNDTGNETLYAEPDHLLIPLYHKIRIPFESVFVVVQRFNNFTYALQIKPDYFAGPLEWDIYLISVNDLKKDLFVAQGLRGTYRRNVLTHPMPRFMWRATALHNNVPVLDLLFDATDIEQGLSFVCAIEYEQIFSRFLRRTAGHAMSDITNDRNVWEWFRDKAFEADEDESETVA